VTAPQGPVTPPDSRPTPPTSWTVVELLRWTADHFAARGIDTPRLDAECLLAHALGTSRLRLYLDFDKPVTGAERAAFRDLVRRRAGERVPVALLVGEKEFWSLSLRVTPDVLVPRPETETLVAAALDLLPGRDAPWRVLDLGTGSGAVALAIARERPGAVITATDVSAEALNIAQENAERLGMAERIRFRQGDGPGPVWGETFDLVVSNPPYVAERDRDRLAPELRHEPALALFAGEDGLTLLTRWIDAAPRLLAPGGGLALEHGADQSEAVARCCLEAGLALPVTHRDLGGRLRVVTARNPGGGGPGGGEPSRGA
jgi:release factor glutamine methyltransferase